MSFKKEKKQNLLLSKRSEYLSLTYMLFQIML